MNTAATKLTKEAATQGTAEMKERWLKSLCFGHYYMKQTAEAVSRLMTPGANGTITLVVGPTGVGKTTLARTLLRQFLLRYIHEIHEDAACIPAILAEVPPASGGVFDWPLFYRELGDRLLVPMWDESVVSRPTPMAFTPETTFDRLPSMRFAAMRALKRRKTRHVFLDECVHFTDSNTSPLEYGNLLKSLANLPGMNLLMLGAYGAQSLVEASAQLSRRVSVVHYPRYSYTPWGREQYGLFLHSLQANIPLPYEVNLLQYGDVLCRGTCGLTGITADVVCRAVINADADLRAGGRKWRDEFLLSVMPTKRQHETILRDCLIGEADILKYLPSATKPTYQTEESLLATIRQERATAEVDS